MVADSIEISVVTEATIALNKEYYFAFWPVMRRMYEAGRKPQIIHADFTIVVSGGTLAETTKPTNEVLNFTTPMQIYLRSSEAADVSKKIYFVGQKADDSFGTFIMTSDASDGTTPVDCGTWKVIMIVNKYDAWAGNAIIDDDGASNEVYWTCALGATAPLGIIAIPYGFYGAPIEAYSLLLNDPGTGNNGVRFDAGDVKGYCNRYATTQTTLEGKQPLPIAGPQRMSIKNQYLGGAKTDAHQHLFIMVWE